MRRIPKGSVIFVERRFGVAKYKHFGIYLGNRRVIHFANEDPDDIKGENAVIHESSLARFAGRNSNEIKKIENDEKNDVEINVLCFSDSEWIDWQTADKLKEWDSKMKNLYRFCLYNGADVVRRAKGCVGCNYYDGTNNKYIYIPNKYDLKRNN